MEASATLVSAHPVGEGKSLCNPRLGAGRWTLPEAAFTPNGTTKPP